MVVFVTKFLDLLGEMTVCWELRECESCVRFWTQILIEMCIPKGSDGEIHSQVRFPDPNSHRRSVVTGSQLFVGLRWHSCRNEHIRGRTYELAPYDRAQTQMSHSEMTGNQKRKCSPSSKYILWPWV